LFLHIAALSSSPQRSQAVGQFFRLRDGKVARFDIQNAA
jgi:hypothetical protein